MLLKWQVKKLGFQRLRDLLNSGMKKKVFGTFYRTTIRSGKKRKKNVGRMSEKLEMTSNYSFLSNVSLNPRSVNDSHQRCSVKKGVLPKACNFSKKESLAQVFFCEFCEISKKTYLINLLTTASGMRGTAFSEAYSEPSQTSKMKLFARIANCFQPLTIS